MARALRYIHGNMLRITENVESGTALRLRLDGTVSPEAFDDLAALCARHRRDGHRVVIVDMAGVNFMSHQTARKLADLRDDGLRIINCSPFIAALFEAAKNVE
jgi:anti-anti-sigma regulatory factor